MKKTTLSILAALFAINASAAELSFNNASISYQQIDFDCSSDCDGLNLSGSLAFNETFFGEFNHFNTTDDASLTFLGLGARHGLSDTSAVYGLLGAARLEGNDESDTKGFAGLGLRGMLTENFEGDLLLRKVFVSGFDPSIRAQGTYFFTDTVGGQLFLEATDGLFGGGVGLRLNF